MFINQDFRVWRPASLQSPVLAQRTNQYASLRSSTAPRISSKRKNPVNIICTFLISLFVCTAQANANNLSISNVTFGDRNPASDKVAVQFNVSWDNAWKSKINHDAVWITVRMYNPSSSPINKKLCQLATSGLNPADTSAGSNQNIQLYIPTDKNGVFLRPAVYGVHSSIASTNVSLMVDYSSCGFAETDTVNVSLFGVEMVYVPEGAFYAGDQAISTASLVEGSADNDPWYISSNGPLSVSDPAANGFRYVSSGNVQEDTTGSSFTISDTFPNGYGAFYAMKYEITEGQWVDFFNSLPSAAARESRDLTDNNHKNSDSIQKRNTISCSGSPLVCTTLRPYRPVTYLNWMDIAAFLDWAALRPMTELEFEKASRGPTFSVQGEYAWGTTSATGAGTISGSNEDGSETVTTSSANAHFGSAILSGGDSLNGAEYAQGPLRSGIFASSESTRESAGASYYGVLDLSGNVRERLVTIGNSTGRGFSGTHGDGYLTSLSGFEGNANELDWPGLDSVPSKGVTGSLGSGLKGGGWDDVQNRLRVSDRQDAANAVLAASNNAGGRGARTYDGN